ncbi:MAG: beta-propeller fold lactonase family protein [Chloroflexi bacterium]|nr:beta-propeller fold lactonase family protein [Chloroflexota bacterium]
MRQVRRNVLRRSGAAALAAAVTALAVAGAFGGAGTASADGRGGAVYTLSNQIGGNSVLVFDRQADGSLTAAGSVDTGGVGTGGGLGSQGAVILTEDNHRLIAVNAGSNDLSVFDVRDGGLTLVDRASSGGIRPVSITVHDNVLYALNAGGSGSIAGFRIRGDGELAPIAGSIQPLTSASAGPAQIQFTPDGEQLIVTEKATNAIVTYEVEDGVASGPVSHASNGATPFGFGFGRRNTLIVSEAFGGAPDASAVSSYRVSEEGDVASVTASAATHQTAACWIVVTKNGRFAYTTNAGSGSISGYRVARDGSLTLLDADGRTGDTGAGSTPVDMALSRDSHFLFALGAGSHAITGFRVGADGSLVPAGSVNGLPAGTVGLAAR